MDIPPHCWLQSYCHEDVCRMLLLAVYLGLTHNTPQVWGYTYTHPLLEQSSWCTEDFKVSQREKEQCMAA